MNLFLMAALSVAAMTLPSRPRVTTDASAALHGEHQRGERTEKQAAHDPEGGGPRPGDHQEHRCADGRDEEHDPACFVFGGWVRRVDAPSFITVLLSFSAGIGLLVNLRYAGLAHRHAVSVGGGRPSTPRGRVVRDEVGRVRGIRLLLANAGAAYISDVRIDGRLDRSDRILLRREPVVELGPGRTAVVEFCFSEPIVCARPMASLVRLEIVYRDHMDRTRRMRRILKVRYRSGAERLVPHESHA